MDKALYTWRRERIVKKVYEQVRKTGCSHEDAFRKIKFDFLKHYDWLNNTEAYQWLSQFNTFMDMEVDRIST